VSRVVFLLVPRLHLLDLAGPAQAFYTAAGLGYPYQLDYVAEQADVPTAQGITVRAGLDWPQLGPDDLIIVPGWQVREPGQPGALSQPGPAGQPGSLSQASLRQLAGHHHRGGTVASVCAGALALGQAGLLDGRRCTTHHEVQEALARSYPRATVVRDVLYVIDGRVVTSAPVAWISRCI
jgi:transcriptional regulator GlxA family with amidase domain